MIYDLMMCSYKRFLSVSNNSGKSTINVVLHNRPVREIKVFLRTLETLLRLLHAAKFGRLGGESAQNI